MKSKIERFVAVIAVAASAVVATGAPASAQRWHGHRGIGWGAGVAGLAAGALIGGAAAAATQPWWGPRYSYDGGYGYYPGYAYSPGYVADPAYATGYDQNYDGYCAQRYRSYDPASGTFLGYDGIRHPCP